MLQVNGKLRGQIEVAADAPSDAVEAAAPSLAAGCGGTAGFTGNGRRASWSISMAPLPPSAEDSI